MDKVYMAIIMLSLLGGDSSSKEYLDWHLTLNDIPCGIEADIACFEEGLILEALDSTNARVRRLAAEKATCFECLDTKIVSKVISLLQDTDPIVREAASEFIKAHSSSCLSSIPYVENMIRNGNYLDRLHGFQALEVFSEYAVPSLIRLAADSESAVSDRALSQLKDHTVIMQAAIVEMLNRRELKAINIVVAAVENGLEIEKEVCNMLEVIALEEGFDMPSDVLRCEKE